MPTADIVALLIAERDKLNRAIEALDGTKTPAIHTPAAETSTEKETPCQRRYSAENGARTEETLRGFESCANVRLFGCEIGWFRALPLVQFHFTRSAGFLELQVTAAIFR
jgi:hypothetical protein